ncbi:unnamed protein product [Prorocentrum cordatum]|uniref:Anaphase-promoting complex subunit 1 n=2 Tax=Prorocentrum cordatum TaxID=2364126 RepID=A0ABN9W1I4_9DINO|nr:unnamed protein product [Polarella glacialis]
MGTFSTPRIQQAHEQEPSFFSMFLYIYIYIYISSHAHEPPPPQQLALVQQDGLQLLRWDSKQHEARLDLRSASYQKTRHKHTLLAVRRQTFMPMPCFFYIARDAK